MPGYPRYTTFRPGELEQRLQALSPAGSLPLSPPRRGRGGRLLKALTVSVTYPDGQAGQCAYARKGPAWHEFRYTYADGSELPRQTVGARLGNDPTAIAAKAQELAPAGYQAALERERQDVFLRAAAPKDRRGHKAPACGRMSVKAARQLAGRYALCLPVGATLIAVGPVRATLEAANQDWRAEQNRRLVVGGCSRFLRCWLLPRFNPLYAEHDPRAGLLPRKEGSPHEAGAA